MADVDNAPRFGTELKDGFKSVNTWVSNGIAWLEDQQQFYRERSTIEREYSSKLSALAKKYFEKKAKRSSGLSVGDSPTLTPGSLERCYYLLPVCALQAANDFTVVPPWLRGLPNSLPLKLEQPSIADLVWSCNRMSRNP